MQREACQNLLVDLRHNNGGKGEKWLTSREA